MTYNVTCKFVELGCLRLQPIFLPTLWRHWEAEQPAFRLGQTDAKSQPARQPQVDSPDSPDSPDSSDLLDSPDLPDSSDTSVSRESPGSPDSTDTPKSPD